MSFIIRKWKKLKWFSLYLYIFLSIHRNWTIFHELEKTFNDLYYFQRVQNIREANCKMYLFISTKYISIHIWFYFQKWKILYHYIFSREIQKIWLSLIIYIYIYYICVCVYIYIHIYIYIYIYINIECSLLKNRAMSKLTNYSK